MSQRNDDGPKCQSCGKYTERIGSFSACANEYCERYAIPVNNQGLTDEEAQVEAIRPLVPDEGAESEDEMQGDGFNASKDFERRMALGGTLHDGVTAAND